MTPSRMLRPVLVSLALSGVGLTTASCGMVDADPHRFESLAQKVADIRLDGSEAPASPPPAPTPLTGSAAESGLRSALRVEVMDPHALWDARDGLKPQTVERQASAAVAAGVEAAAPAVARAVVQQVSTRATEAVRPSQVAGLRPATTGSRTIIQLGAYSSEAAARTAWAAARAGAARQALNGLSPVFEQTTVNGRTLTRLKVAAPASAAVAICRAAHVSDPWCARRV